MLGRRYRPDIILFVLTFFIVYLCNAGGLRILRDDWCNISRLRTFLPLGAEGLMQVVSNAWVMSPRVFFLSWLVQGAFALAFGFTPAPYFLFILTLHALSALLLGSIILEMTENSEISRAASLLFLVFPTNANALFFLNNWFFVLPTFFLLLTTHLHLKPLRNPYANLLSISLTSLACQFSGEQTLPVLYLAFLGFTLLALKRRRCGDFKWKLLQALIPAVLCGSSLLAYTRAFTLSHMPPPGVSASALNYIEQTVGLFWKVLRFNSWIYAGASVPPSWPTWALILALLLTLTVMSTLSARKSPLKTGNFQIAALITFLCLIASLGAGLWGAMTGYRPSPETRYLYLPGLFASVLVTFLLAALAHAFKTRREVALMAFSAAAVMYCGSLMIYNVRDVWGAQTAVDRRIWNKIDRHLNPSIRFILTDNLFGKQLLPPGSSDAVSDFQADWGIHCRLTAISDYRVRIISGYQDGAGDEIRVFDYYGASTTTIKPAVLPVVVRSTGRLNELPHAFLAVFENFKDYERFQSDEKRLWAAEIR